MTRAATTHCQDWLVIGQEPWDEVQRRNQLLIRAIAARHPRARFLFAELPLRSRDVARWRQPVPRQVADNIWAVQTIRPLPGAAGASVSDRSEAAQIRRAMRGLGIDRPMLWTQDPRAADLVDHLPHAGLVYDLTDDWAAFETDPGRRAAVQARIERLGRRADIVLACSRALETGAQAWSRRVHHLPNAVEPEREAGATPAELRDLPRPLLGYVGTQHGSRLDVTLLETMAAQRPAWSFVLLGPDHLSAEERDRLRARPNVHHLGVRPHDEVRGYVEALDVCLIPHIVNDFTRSLDPLKLYEYLAAGRPVVATPVDNAPDLQAHILTADDADGLIAACELAIAEDSPAAVAARRAAVQGATWDARAAEIDELLGVVPDDARRMSDGVDVVIVSFNTRELLERCLTTVGAQVGVDGLRTIVVDNGSADGSQAMVRERFPEVELIELSDNAGFARANNVAFEHCRGEHVLLLNSDAFLARDAVVQLVGAARRHPEAAGVGPRLLNVDGTLQRSAWPFPHAGRIMLEALGLHLILRRVGLLEDLGTWAHDEERPVPFVIGACLLLRRDVLEAVGGFDEDFWLYGEEADLQRRLATRGWPVVFTPATEVTHVGGASSTATLPKLRHFYGGQRRFLSKHGGPGAWPVALVALVVGSVLRRKWLWVRVGMRP